MFFSEISKFLGEIETNNFTVSNNEITIFGFSLFGTIFFSSKQTPHEFWIKIPHHKVKDEVYLSDIMSKGYRSAVKLLMSLIALT